MKRSLVLAVSLLVAASATADERYVPLGSGGAARPLVTDVRIVNTSPHSATAVLELLEADGADPKSTTITLVAGETVQWSDVAGQLFRGADFGVLRIACDEPLVVTARNHCLSCGSTSTVPVLEASQAMEEGAIATGLRSKDPAWQRGVGVVNPDGAPALVTVSLHDGDEVIDETFLQLPPRGVRLVRVDDLFAQPSTESGGWLTFSSPRPVLLFGYDANGRGGAAIFTPAQPAISLTRRRRRAVRSAPPVVTQQLALTPTKDNTLYQTSNGSLSNGAGVHIFAGSTGSGERRRAVMAFDIASQIPPGSRITGAVLRLQVSTTVAGPQSMALHPLTSDWGQGSSNGGSAIDGSGRASSAGDATWIHTFFPDRFWSTPGGDFVPASDASTTVGAIGGYNWASSAAMIARVQDWLDRPSANFGWIVIGNESIARTAKRFDSREIQPNATAPTLTIDFIARP